MSERQDREELRKAMLTVIEVMPSDQLTSIAIIDDCSCCPIPVKSSCKVSVMDCENAWKKAAERINKARKAFSDLSPDELELLGEISCHDCPDELNRICADCQTLLDTSLCTLSEAREK